MWPQDERGITLCFQVLRTMDISEVSGGLHVALCGEMNTLRANISVQSWESCARREVTG